MKKFLLLILTFVLMHNALMAQQSKLPYPILFIHGVNSSSDTWNATKNYLIDSLGLTNGGRLDFCLNFDANNATSNLSFYPTSNADIKDFYSLGSLSIGDLYFMNFDVDAFGGVPANTLIDVNSNEQAIIKQGLCIQKAIQHVLDVTGKDKIILFGHSMGGLASREYLQDNLKWQTNDGQHHVAKLVTTGTPHQGSNADLGIILNYLFVPTDMYSDAARDLRTTYSISGDSCVYLYGGIESSTIMDNSLIFPYYNFDVNANTIIGETIIGLNDKFPTNDLEYSCIIGDCNCNILLPEGDGVVSKTSANINHIYPSLNASIFEFEQFDPLEIHRKLPGQYRYNLRGLDEPSNYNFVYKVELNKEYKGFTTMPSANDPNTPHDYDIFKFTVDSLSDIIVDISNITLNNLQADVMDNLHVTIGNIEYANGTTSINFARYLPAGDYFLRIKGTVSADSDIKPYDFKLTPCKLNVFVSTSNNFIFTMNITDGVPPFMYSLDSGAYQSNNVFSGLIPGTHNIKVKDSKNCSGQINFNVPQPPACALINQGGPYWHYTYLFNLGSVAGIASLGLSGIHPGNTIFEIEYNGAIVASSIYPVIPGTSLNFIYSPGLGGPFYATVHVYDNLNLGPPVLGINCPVPGILTQELSSDIMCASESLNISYTSFGATFNANNIFTVQLSNSNGSFINPVPIGTIASVNTSGTIPVTIPSSTNFGTGYRIRIISSDSVYYGIRNGSPLTILDLNSPTVFIAQSGGTNPTCLGATLTFTATHLNGGSPKYQWIKNGLAISGATNSTYSSNSFADGDVLQCTMKSSTTCDSSYIPSNAFTVSFSTSLNPSVSITASSNNVCSGTSITFTATVNNGVGPYLWKKNGTTTLSTTTNPTYTTTSLVNGDIVTCTLSNPSYICVPPANLISNGITMAITPKVTPTISIISSAGNQICAGATVTFSSTITNGGAAPTYQWRLNGVDIAGATSPTYITSSLATGNVITCRLTSNVICPTNATVTSNSITMSVFQNVPPTITITTPTNTICTGTNITFSSAQTNGGIPTYQWMKNGSPISGATSSSYSSNSLVNGDVISCNLTSSLNCLPVTFVSSNSITMAVGNSFAPVFSISSPTNSICSGNSLTFTITPGPGVTGNYQWRKNSTTLTTTSNLTYTTSNLANNDTITCRLVNTAYSCLSIEQKTSNPIILSVNPTVTPSISISASGNSVCAGTSITYTASPVNGGSAPQYQWRVNGTSISGATGITYTRTPLNGDVISCQMTSNISCPSTAIVTSNSISMTINPVPASPIIVISPSSTICNGDSIRLSCNTTNNQWWSTNKTASTLTPLSGQTDSVLYVKSNGYYVVSTTANGCISAISNMVKTTVNANPGILTATISDPTVCLGDFINLSASCPADSNKIILKENFNGATNNWVKLNNSTGGTPANAAWTLRPNGYNSFYSTDASQFYLSNSDAQGPGGITQTYLQSPSFNTLGLSTCLLEYELYYRDLGALDSLFIDYSFDGNSWVDYAYYPGTTGKPKAFLSTSLSLNFLSNQPTVFVRFRYNASFGWYVAIDNVTISGKPVGSNPLQYNWISQPAGFSSGVQNPQNVFPLINTNYNITATNVYGCSKSAQTGVVVFQAQNVEITGLDSLYDISDSPVTLAGIPTGGIFSGPGIVGNVFNPSLAGIGGPYQITYTYTDANLCQYSTMLETMVSGGCIVPATPASIISVGGASKMCPGETKSYRINTVPNATSYTWIAPSGATILSGQGTKQISVNYTNAFIASDTLRVTANNTCGSSDQKKLKIAFNTPVKPGAITGPLAVCANQAGVPYSIAPVSNAVNYTWVVPSGAKINDGTVTSTSAQLTTTSTSVLVNFKTTPGQVKVKSNNACGSSIARTLAVSFNCREDEYYVLTDTETMYLIYPNPTKGEITIETNDAASTSQISVSNILGQLCFEQTINFPEGKAKLNLSHLNEGVYFIHLNNGSDVITKKIVIN